MDGDGIVISRMCLGYPIVCRAVPLDEGLQVLLTGGCRGHIGAVTTLAPGEAPRTEVFPGHKDHLVSQPWAETLGKTLGETVCVVVGIHYDSASREDIQAILQTTQALLAALLEQLPSMKYME